MTADHNQKPATPAPASATPTAAVAGGVGAMAVCCTLTLLIAAGLLGTLSGLTIGGIAVGAGIAIAATAWLTVVILHRRRTHHEGCCTPADADTSAPTEPPRFSWRLRTLER